MVDLNLSDLNTIIALFGLYVVLYGILSVKIKNVWYLGEALFNIFPQPHPSTLTLSSPVPAIMIGIFFGPIAARYIVPDRWGGAVPYQTSEITLGFTRVMIGIQLIIAGYQLPAKYQQARWKDMLLVLIPVMTMMWLCTTACVLATIPKLSLLSAMVIAACVTCTDPVLSQAVAKGPFSDKYVARPVREMISSEAGLNDGFGFPFLMLATYLMRHASDVQVEPVEGHGGGIHPRAGDVGRLGGGVGVAIKNWVLYTMLYYVILGAIYGAVVGTLARYALKYSLRRKWIDSESYLLVPMALGLFCIGSAGLFGSNDLIAAFAAGSALNWDGEYLAETLKRHDEVNSSIDVLLNFGGFIYLGSIFPWNDFQSEATGITYGRLVGLGFLVLIFRRIPAIMLTYKLMPHSIRTWKEALFVGYFGPIGVGAAFYIEHTRHVFPRLDETNDTEVNDLLRAMGPVVYWLAFFSIVVHGLSIPLLERTYNWMGVQPIQDDAVEMRRKSIHVAAPPNAVEGDKETFIAYNRFSRPVFNNSQLPDWRDEYPEPRPSGDLERRKSESGLSPALATPAPRHRSRSRSTIRFVERRGASVGV
ncbi:Na+/H+ antiporter 2 [Sodiomyces alkalinus F11]|uniref:Na+/H+ antiporter 2 n=1 Tax=Sodiomyces alkalinus (strain CBS 110278 / VKM F-3762 / F11) TaxID=1314773 RepID=A0A3N2PPW1_SODAK|nr:Na+/H+ antiporter 2 [Sodiomyces alkalinus F11]ROT36541.1 Na+/H+ antiporter 2 [Sodiomyces alkalinus F11]